MGRYEEFRLDGPSERSRTAAARKNRFFVRVVRSEFVRDELTFRKREGNGRETEGRGLWRGQGNGRYNGARAPIIITRLVFGDKMPRDPIGRTHRPDATRI